MEKVGENIDVPGEKPKRSTSPELEATRLRQRFLTKMQLGLAKLEDDFPNIRFSQLKGFKDFVAYLEEGDANVQGWFRQPTGAGKTVFFAWLIRLLNEETVVLVPNNHLITQTRDEFIECGIPLEDIGLMGGGNDTGRRKVTIITYQSYLKKHGEYKDVPLIVCDEAHKSIGEQTREAVFGALGEEYESEEIPLTDEEEAAEDAVLQVLSEQKGGEVAILGFTATPVMRKKNVADYFGRCISEVRFGELIKAKILKKVLSIAARGEIEADMDGEYMSKEQEEVLLKKENSFKKLLNLYAKFREEEPDVVLRTAVFCNTVNSCKEFLALAVSMGYRGMIVTGSLGSSDLKEAEQKLLAGEIDLIITVDKLKEGWNFPPLNSVIWARATSSPAAFIQGVGRALRAYQSEENAYLFEIEWYRKGGHEGESGRSENERDKEETESDERESSRLSKKALSFAQALVLIGEDPYEVLGNAPGEIHFNQYVQLVDGEGIYGVGEGTPVIGIRKYADKVGVNKITLASWLEAAGVAPLKAVHGQTGVRTVAVYPKVEVDLVIEKKRGASLPLNEGVAIFRRSDGSEVELVALTAYASHKGLSPSVLRKQVEKEVQSVEGVKGLTGGNPVNLYPKDKVDSLIARDKDSLVIVLPLTKGRVEFVIGENPVGLIGLTAFARVKGIAPKTMEAWAEKENVRPRSGLKGRIAGHPVDLYEEVLLEAIVKRKRGEKQVSLVEGAGEVEDESGEVVQVIGIHAYSEVIGVTSSTLKAWILEKKLAPVTGVMWTNGSNSGEVYKKKAVDALVEEKRGSDLRIKLTEGIGILAIEGVDVEVVGLAGYAKSHAGVGDTTLKEWVEEMGVKRIEGTKGDANGKTVEVYRKEDVDTVIELKRGGGIGVAIKKGVGSYTSSGGKEVEVVGLAGYAAQLDIGNTTLEAWVTEAGLKPLPGYSGIVGGRPVALYPRSIIDQLIRKKATENKDLVELKNGLGQLTLEDKIIEVVGLAGYSKAYGVYVTKLESLVKEAGITPIEGMQGISGNQKVTLYRREDIDPIITEIKGRSEKLIELVKGVGRTEINEIVTEVIGATSYARSLGIDRVVFLSWLAREGIKAIEGKKGKGGSLAVDIYPKSAVDALLKSKGRL